MNPSRMQTLESLHGISPSNTYIVNQHPEGSPAVMGWPQQYAPMEQPGGANAHPYVMNVIKPDQSRVRVDHQQPPPAAANMGAQPNPSVITATYNPTYNRCLPKILSDLDCEMKIKQVLKCIENILLEGNELDQHQSYKLPDRSSSPQLKRPKVKEDEELLMAQSINAPSTGAAAPTKGASTNKSPVRINVKVEPSEPTEKAQRTMLNMYQPDQQSHQVPSASPRNQSYDGSSQATSRMPQSSQQATQFNKQPTARAYSFEQFNYPGSGQPSFVQQSFMPQQQQQQLQAQHTLLMQHMANQQHIQQQLQQQLMNSGIHVIPHLNNMALQHMQYPSNASSQSSQATSNHQQSPPVAHVPQFHEQTQQQPPSSSQVPDNAYPSVHMDEFPLPVFSNTILEEVRREEPKKEGEEPVYFFGSSPTSNSLYYTHAHTQQQQPPYEHAAQADGSHQQDQQTRTPNPLGASLSQLHPFLFQMPQLNGLPLEEDDKWILSLLNIDGHENPNAVLGPAPVGL